MSLHSLRARILSSVATSTIVLACGGETNSPTTSSSGTSGATSSSTSSSGGSSGTTPATCENGRQKKHTCNAKGAGITKNSGYGGVRDPDAAPPPPPTLDANGCIVVAEIMNGCCNPAIGTVTLEDGQCCYDFCEGSCCGRPLVVDGMARVARPTPRRDWGTAPAAATVPPLTRDALADAYLRDALMEHASIASFATFTLELLAVGAPPALLVLAQAACADEIEHARLTFAIANSYREEPRGPNALELRGVAPSTDLASIARATVRDGCINETIASAVAAAQAANATDPELRATLARIAEDEARHAELAWQFVRWALEVGGADVSRAVTAAFAEPVSASAAPLAAGVDETLWQSHGRLLPSEHRTLVTSVLAEVIRPCASLLV